MFGHETTSSQQTIALRGEGDGGIVGGDVREIGYAGNHAELESMRN